jgi:GntR family transcriptional regulator, transcriptional repressor for pyruvate dehydrogenase complex
VTTPAHPRPPTPRPPAQGIEAIKPLERETRLDAATNEIRRRIADGQLVDGQRLPTEADMARDLGISRPLLREVLARLRAEGYIETAIGIGSFVRLPTEEDLAAIFARQLELPTFVDGLDADALYEVRTTLETATAQAAATRATPEMIEELGNLLARMREYKHYQAEYTAADVGFHIAVARASGNPLYPIVLRPLVTMIVEGIFESHGVHRATDEGIAGHAQVLAAIKRRQPKAAGRAMATHLAQSRAVFPERVTAQRSTPRPPAATWGSVASRPDRRASVRWS